MRVVLRTDGGARGNPGPAAGGFVIEDAVGTVIRAAARYLGETTNNVAEYEALIAGLRCALAEGATAVEVYADSELVVRQVNGVYKVKHANMKPLFLETMRLLREFDTWAVTHVLRAENSAADALVNEAIVRRADVGDPVPCADEGPGRGQQTLFG